MTRPSPKISIITVVRNSPGELKKTIASILEQDYPHLEFILIDGGSQDETLEVIKAHESRIAYWVSEPDQGIYDAMNKGIANATGEWVNFMNAGDTFTTKDILSQVFSGEINLNGTGVIYGDSIAAYPHSRVLKAAGPPARMVTGMVFCHQAAFVKRELIGPGGFDLSFPIGADFKVLFGLYSSGFKFKQLPLTIAVFDASGISNLRMVQSACEHYRIVRNFKRLTFSERFYHYRFILRVAIVSLGYRLLPEKWVQHIRSRKNPLLSADS
jgi:glycosyltransferase involved in cell wall biosynthesis